MPSHNSQLNQKDTKMDLQLNAVEDDASGSDTSPPRAPPPAFTMPVSRISASAGASLSSILSAESPQTPNQAPPPFELPGARRGGLAGLMNSPLTPVEPPRSYMQAMGAPVHVTTQSEVQETPEQRHETSYEPTEPQTKVLQAEEAEEGEEAEQDEAMEEEETDSSPQKRRRGSSVASESSAVAVATPPIATQSPASVAIEADALVLQDTELESIKSSLQAAIQRFLSAEAKAKGGPPSKRPRKGKQSQQAKKRASAQGAAVAADGVESLEDVAECIAKLQDKITMELMEVDVLREVVRLCLVFLGVVTAAQPIVQGDESSVKDTLTVLQSKPVHLQLASTVRRVVFSVSEDSAAVILADVYDWLMATCGADASASWGWLLVFCAQFDSSSVVNFLVKHTVFEEQRSSLTRVVLEHFATHHHSGEIVEAVSSVLQQLTHDDGSGRRTRVETSLARLLVLLSGSPTLLLALDDSFQWILTSEVVTALFTRADQAADRNDRPSTNGSSDTSSLTSRLLELIDNRSDVLGNSLFQLLLLLQQLSINRSSEPQRRLAKIASDVHGDVVRVAQHQEKSTILHSVHRRLPYIAQTVLEQLSTESADKESPAVSWKDWLNALASFISRQQVTGQLLQADLTQCESLAQNESPRVPVTSFCGLLCYIVDPSSSDFVALVRELSHRLQHVAVATARRRRLLDILQHLLKYGADHHPADARFSSLEFKDTDACQDLDQIVQAFNRMSPWQERWSELEQWQGANGADLWEYLLDLVVGVGKDDDELSSQALQLLTKTPFPSLEDPAWQFRCLRKLTTVYFYMLRRYRVSMIDLEVQEADQHVWQMHLHLMQTVIRRVCTLEGAVAHYPSSVFTQFSSLWLDALFSTASATSVPTHFPSSTKGDSLSALKKNSLGASDHAVIRSERTISSKCTNLQSSQVITKHSETLVYRKALDETWEREMHAAFTCSMLASGVLSQLLTSAEVDADKRERRLKGVVDMLLERATPCCGVPSDDVYKEILPNRSSFDMDLRIEQWLNHFPVFLQLLRVVIEQSAGSAGSVQALRLVPVVKSALVVLLGHWNSVKGELQVENMDVPPYMRNRNQLALSCEIMRILRVSGWLPEPLARTADLLPLTTPADIRAILFSCWFYLADHPPSATASQANPVPGSPVKMPVEFYVLPVRKALHRNIHKIGAKYPQFMC